MNFLLRFQITTRDFMFLPLYPLILHFKRFFFFFLKFKKGVFLWLYASIILSSSPLLSYVLYGSWFVYCYGYRVSITVWYICHPLSYICTVYAVYEVNARELIEFCCRLNQYIYICMYFIYSYGYDEDDFVI